MVDQHSGVSLTQLEQSILETIEADAEHVDAGYDVADTDTSSFILDGDVESSFSPHQQKHDKEPLGSRRLRSAPVSTGTSRPRAATEAERSSTTARTEIASTLSSGQSPSGLKTLHRFGSTDSLRSKRNTISSSTRPFYPSTSPAHDGTSKRHSSISPLSPKARMTSARAVVSSFSTNSTPSTSPREQATLQPSAPSSRTTRHQQKEYSIGIRSTMSHLSSMSVGIMAPTTSRRNVSSDAISAHIVASSPGSSDSAKRSRRSGSATMSMANLSPAAMELLKQQERLQEQERGALKGALAISPHSSRPVQSVGEDEKRSNVQVTTASGFVHADEISQGQPRHGSGARYSKDERRYVSQSDSEKTKGNPGSFNDTRRQQSTSGSSGVDASAFTLLYKEIRDSMDATSFGLFARGTF